jgi:hypothetical protein
MATVNNSTFDKLAKRFNYGSIKPLKSSGTIYHWAEQWHFCVSAKTGSGKSLCFQGLTYLYSELGVKENPIVLVFRWWRHKFGNNRQISASYIGKDSSENGDICRGKYLY